MNKPVFLVGPTAVGKSKVASILAPKVNAEIINCDSMQVYQGMDIVTAKPSPVERRQLPHHLVDIVNISQEYDVAQYQLAAQKVITEVQKKGKTPLVVGGTGLYVISLLVGLFQGPGRDQAIRDRLAAKIAAEGNEALHNQLRQIDPVAAEKINKNDSRRLIRALEVYQLTGKPISSWQEQWHSANKDLANDLLVLGLTREREDLYARIDGRVEEMFRQGLVEEVKKLIGQGLLENKTARQALGVKEIAGYLRGEYSLAEARQRLQRSTRQFAKRQLTWFRKDDRVIWFFVDRDEPAEGTVEKIIKHLNKR